VHLASVWLPVQSEVVGLDVPMNQATAMDHIQTLHGSKS